VGVTLISSAPIDFGFINFFTRMDSVSAGGAAGFENLVAAKVGLGRRGGSNEYGFVGHADKERILITISS